MREHLTAVVLCSCLLCATSFNVGHTIPLPGWKGRPSSRSATLLVACNARILVDFADQAQVHPWRGVNDVIMGGRSTGSMTFDSAEAGGRGAAVFTGVVTSAGGGGFSSVRPTMLIRIGTHAHQHMHAIRLDVFVWRPSGVREMLVVCVFLFQRAVRLYDHPLKMPKRRFEAVFWRRIAPHPQGSESNARAMVAFTKCKSRATNVCRVSNIKLSFRRCRTSG